MNLCLKQKKNGTINPVINKNSKKFVELKITKFEKFKVTRKFVKLKIAKLEKFKVTRKYDKKIKIFIFYDST